MSKCGGGTQPCIGWRQPSTVVSKAAMCSKSKFMLPWSFSEEAAAAKHAAQLQHNMWVVAARGAVLSVITGGGRWVEIKTHADPLYQHLIVTAERKFWRCVETRLQRVRGIERHGSAKGDQGIGLRRPSNLSYLRDFGWHKSFLRAPGYFIFTQT